MNSSPPSFKPPLAVRELEARLDESLDPVLSSRRTAQPLAEKFAAMTRDEQDFALHWVGVIARTSGELAYQFASLAPDVVPKADPATAEAWIIHAMDTFDREGLYRGSAELKSVDGYLRSSQHRERAVEYADASRVLSLFICGLAGRPLKLDVGTEAYTDTETIHLPASIFAGDSRAQNFFLYKALATHLWAQARYGTFNVEPAAKLAVFSDPARALTLFNYLETTRIDAIIARELPGLARELSAFRQNVESPPECARLRETDATAADSLALVERLYTKFEPPNLSYMGVMHPEIAQAVRASRVEREKQDLRAELAKLPVENRLQSSTPGDDESAPQYSMQEGADGIQLMFDGAPLSSSAHVKDLLESIAQDLDEIPADYLAPTGDAAAPDDGATAADSGRIPEDANPDKDALYYNEWDYKRRHYRKNWCVLHETDVEPGESSFVDKTLEQYSVQVTQLRRTFEMLRGEDKWLKRQPAGDDIDLDAVITAYADLRSGRELPEQLLQRREKAERDIAVMFMVDMSGSTKGWINDAERESLVMLCEALEVLGDRYAIYGFSGITRKRCAIYRIKRFNEAYDNSVKRRIAGIQPQDYTRMGVAIRHLTAMLNAVDARTKLLITLSDGKPDDYSDNYRGEYGIEDTRQALIEAHRGGIHPFCITIDREAREYLPRMYGAVNYTVIEDVARLPLKVADVYRRLTT
ncbi:MAG: nitric oxide reductase activation protein [Betaproteobacteria bacterium]|nr:nitric oxide reductase activation protein [Betaproteobacteria bacterium]